MAIWNRIRRVWTDDYHSWQSIEDTPIPLSIGRIWLADKDGNARRAMSWTWPALKRREPGKYRQWMMRTHGEKEPPSAAV
ncbi:MAG: hypothetical protein V4458_14915 [Pseudomonadota bacterium]|nr:hypothetical protein [Afipia sp.]